MTGARDTVENTARTEQQPRVAAFFDLDKTIIARSSSLAFSRPFYREGLLNRRAVLRSAYAQFVFQIGGADHDQMERLRGAMQQMVAGWSVHQVSEVVSETLHELIDPLVYEEAVALIDEHRTSGHDVVIVSSSGTEVVRPIGQMLGADDIVATRMVVEDGHYTGEIEYYAYGETKAAAVLELANERGYDLSASYAYSDSVTDLPMLRVVGHPFAVNPDRSLRRVADDEGWPVLRFQTPVALRHRLPRVSDLPARQRYAAAGAVVAGAAAGVVWFAARRSRAAR
jgi:HAD superfamily hydrolase (TIGR01490 family)